MRTILPPHIARIDQPLVSLVDQSGGLQGVAGALSPHTAMREAVQLLINEWIEPIERLQIAATPGQE
jgi:hypothetical protein